MCGEDLADVGEYRADFADVIVADAEIFVNAPRRGHPLRILNNASPDLQSGGK